MITKKRKATVIKKVQVSPADTGSADVQIALLTERITELTNHLKVHKKDVSSRMGLVKMVAERRRMLNYLKRKDLERYTKILAQLEIRK